MVPLYFLMDWILRLMLEAAFGMVKQPAAQPAPAEAISDGPEDDIETEVDKIRKIIKKKVYTKIAEDPELGPKLLEPIKSQGVRQMDDSAMIMRVKYKTKPGDQFAIRKEVYRLMQEAFKEEGIDFAHRNVTVYMPPETGSETAAQTAGEVQPEDAQPDSNVARQAAAAAALALIQAEEEEMAKKKSE